MTGLRTELHSEISGLGKDIRGEMRQQFLWLLGVMLTMITSMIGVVVTVLVRVF